MKKLFIIFSIASFLMACGNSKPGDKQSELKALKSQEEDLKKKISGLEAELAVKDTSKKSEAKLVAVTDMLPRMFRHYIEVQAKVEGEEDISIGPEMMGTVKSVSAHAGDHVAKGQVLASLDDAAMEASIAEVQTQLDLATTVYNRQKNLWDQKIGSEVQYLQAKTGKESLEKRLATLHDQWDMMRIKSPITGVVDEVDVKAGQSIAPGMQAFRVVNLSDLKIRGEVAESYISKVSQGNPVVIYFPDQEKEVKTSISYSGQVINKLNRTFNVEVKLHPDEGNFHPNQVAVLKIIDYTSDKAFVVPVGAVQKSQDGEFVYVATNSPDASGGNMIVKRKTIVSGLTYGGLAEVKTGLESGDKVITNGYQNVIEGDPVKL